MDLEDTGFLLKTSNPTWTNDPTSMSNVSILSIHIRTPSYKNARLLMSDPAGDTRNEIHSGVFNLHATEAAPLSEDCGNHFRGHCSLVWKITVRNSASRSKINTRASIHYFFVGGFFSPPLSLFQWQNGGIIFHSMSELVFFPSHITPFGTHLISDGNLCPISLSLAVCLCLAGSLSSILLNKWEMKAMIAMNCWRGSAEGWISDKWNIIITMAWRA